VFYSNPNSIGGHFTENEQNQTIDPKKPPNNIDQKFLDVICTTEKKSIYSQCTDTNPTKLVQSENNGHTQEKSKIFTDFSEAMKFSKLNTPSQLKRLGDSWVVELK